MARQSLGSEINELKGALKIFGKRAEPFDRVLLVGGGNLGLRLAKALEGMSIHTKLIEKDPDRCRELAEHLDKVVVLQGDGSDQRLLQEENIQDMDVVATLTGDEETNILTSLLAKRIGAQKTVTRISKFSYFPLVSLNFTNGECLPQGVVSLKFSPKILLASGPFPLTECVG